MTRAQENAVDRLALDHGRLAVREGYCDEGVRVWTPTAAHFIIHLGGDVAQQRACSRFDIDWSYSA